MFTLAGLAGAVQWLEILQQIASKGKSAWDRIKQALADEGIDADNEKLDAIILDAERRKTIAENEAKGGQ